MRKFTLAELFEKTPHQEIKWVIGNTIDAAQPLDIKNWVLAVLSDSKYGSSKEMLCYAITKMAPREEAIPALIAAFERVPAHAAEALGKIGDETALQFLLDNQQRDVTKLAKNNIEKAITMIQKRLSKKK